MDQLPPGDATPEELILFLLERIKILDRFVLEIDRQQEALAKALFEVRPELSHSFLRHMNAITNSSAPGAPDRISDATLLYDEIIRRVKEKPNRP